MPIHYRISVAADGSNVERIDLLSQLISQKSDAGHKAVAISSSQLASNIPVETWLYSSHLYQLPVFIATMDGSVWLVANGKIHKFTKAEIDDLESKKEKKK